MRQRVNQARDTLAAWLVAVVVGLVGSPAYRQYFRDVIERGVTERNDALAHLHAHPFDWQE